MNRVFAVAFGVLTLASFFAYGNAVHCAHCVNSVIPVAVLAFCHIVAALMCAVFVRSIVR